MPFNRFSIAFKSLYVCICAFAIFVFSTSIFLRITFFYILYHQSIYKAAHSYRYYLYWFVLLFLTYLQIFNSFTARITEEILMEHFSAIKCCDTLQQLSSATCLARQIYTHTAVEDSPLLNISLRTGNEFSLFF